VQNTKTGVRVISKLSKKDRQLLTVRKESTHNASTLSKSQNKRNTSKNHSPSKQSSQKKGSFHRKNHSIISTTANGANGADKTTSNNQPFKNHSITFDNTNQTQSYLDNPLAV
jgi:hypothetical protein